MSSLALVDIVNFTYARLNVLHQNKIAQTPKVMNYLTKAAWRVAQLPDDVFIDAEYVKGARAANGNLLPSSGNLMPFMFCADGEMVLGMCNLHLLNGRFLVAQCLYTRHEPASIDEDGDEFINLLSENLVKGHLEDTIVFLANVMRIKGMTTDSLNEWLLSNYRPSKKRGRHNETFSSFGWGQNAVSLLDGNDITAIMENGWFQKPLIENVAEPATYINKTQAEVDRILLCEAAMPPYDGELQCIVCCARRACMAFPCGHMMTCATCTQPLAKCAMRCDVPKKLLYIHAPLV